MGLDWVDKVLADRDKQSELSGGASDELASTLDVMSPFTELLAKAKEYLKNKSNQDSTATNNILLELWVLSTNLSEALQITSQDLEQLNSLKAEFSKIEADLKKLNEQPTPKSTGRGATSWYCFEDNALRDISWWDDRTF